MKRLLEEASEVIVRRCREEISPAYTYTPEITTLPKVTADDMEPDISVICETENKTRFVKEIEFPDFFLSCLIRCELKALKKAN